MIKIQNNNVMAGSMWILIAIILPVIISDIVLSGLNASLLKQLLYPVSIISVTGFLVAALKLENKAIKKLLPQVAFLVNFLIVLFVFLFSEPSAYYPGLMGLCLLLIWYGNQASSKKLALTISILAALCTTVMAIVLTKSINLIIVLFLFMMVSIALGQFLVTPKIMSTKNEDDKSEQQDLTEDAEYRPTDLDYAMVDVHDGEQPNDWEYVLRELHQELKSTHDVDALFKKMLLFMSGAIDYDAAVAGLIQGQSLNKISVTGPESMTHAKVLAWTNELVSRLSNSKQSVVSQQEITNEKGDIKNLYRIDVPVISSNKMLGLVSILRESMCFNEYETKLANSIVFHSMIALQQARMQEELKRQVTTAPANKTLYSREQFLDQAQLELDKISQPRALSILLVELDDLEKVADDAGREVAAQLYKTVASTILSQMQPHDVLGRHGNSGLIVMLHETDLLEAKKRAENFREKVSQAKCKTGNGVVSTTVSIGLASVSEAGETLKEVIKKADMGLFVAIESGRNSVKVSL